MGARLVGEAFAVVAASSNNIKPNEALLLAYMCLTALDGDAQPRYFAAPAASAIGLGRMLPEEDCAERRSILELVRRAQQGLERAGLIERVKKGARGTRSEWRITLHNQGLGGRLAQQIVGKTTQQIVGHNPTESWEQPNEKLALRSTGTTGTTSQEKSRLNQAPHFEPVDNSHEGKNAA